MRVQITPAAPRPT